jgi:site-specific DNA-cytosine methylase
MRKRLLIVAVLPPFDKQLDDFLNFDDYQATTTLSAFMGKSFVKDTAYTIRCGGKYSAIDDKHNWDGYIVNGKEYRLTKADCLKLQGFDSKFVLCGTSAQQWKQLGNTIPTVFTHMLGQQILKIQSNSNMPPYVKDALPI